MLSITKPAADQQRTVAVFMSFSGDGGVERMVTHLLRGFIDQGVAVDLVLAKAKGSMLDRVPAEVNIIKLGTQHTFASLPALVRYLKSRQPRALLVAKHRAGIVAFIARRLARYRGRVILRLGTTVSAALKGKNAIQKALWYGSMRFFYRGADAIVAVSEGVRQDVLMITHLPPEKITVIRNPVVTPAMQVMAQQPVDHPWLQSGSVPVILASGRFTRQKGFKDLIQAFARVHAQLPCRLIILGRGREQQDYEQLAAQLNVAEAISLPGFVANPYAYLAHAQLFVLSSYWEGSPNVLTEAMALGVPVVATDCPSGPREILRDGRYGPLVPMGDIEGLAQAMLMTLRQPLPAAKLHEAVADYHVDVSAAAYLAALGLMIS